MLSNSNSKLPTIGYPYGYPYGIDIYGLTEYIKNESKMADINSYSRRPRKAIWLQIDEYNSVLSAKNIFEKKIGPAQWGTFIAFLAGVYMGSIELNNTLKRNESDNGKMMIKE